MSSTSAVRQLAFFQEILMPFRHWQCVQAEAVGKYCLTSATRAGTAFFLPKPFEHPTANAAWGHQASVETKPQPQKHKGRGESDPGTLKQPGRTCGHCRRAPASAAPLPSRLDRPQSGITQNWNCFPALRKV